MRIAYFGPAPHDVGGLAFRVLNTTLGLLEAGHEVEMYVDGAGQLSAELVQHPLVTIHQLPSKWRYDRWYSSSNATKLLTGNLARLHVQRRLVRMLRVRHRSCPFDVLYRVSQIELPSLRRHLNELPPLVVHPGTHAYGEFVWHWRERSLARRAESPALFIANHLYLGYRSLVQRRDLPRAACVIAVSRCFATQMAHDYRIPADRFRAIPNPVALDRFRPAEDPPLPGPIRLLFIARMSVRKGVEDIVALSQRLDDLHGRLSIDCVGGASLFSDYRVLLEDLNPRIARYFGSVDSKELPALYRACHGLLQPSRYEPFGNAVGEALASGLPVVVTDQVGAGEDISADACRKYIAGDVGALERLVRELVLQLEGGEGAALSRVARAEAIRRFDRSIIAASVTEALRAGTA